MRNGERPTLWHIVVSHFSEKARWALDYKSVEHERRAPPPGMHMPIVYVLSRGRAITLPMLELDGERIVDSTAIIAALERRFPEPALYPQDPDERRRALELEDHFDEQLGPYVRRLAFYELRREPALLAEMAPRVAPELARFGRVLVPYTRLFTGLRYRASDDSGAEHARAKILAGLDRLEAELNAGEYLVGGRFTVADLTAAALLYPLVLPAEGPRYIERMPEPYESFRAQLDERPAFAWVREMFARHRGASGNDASPPARAPGSYASSSTTSGIPVSNQ
jgi:glutathione S-transferase